MKNPILLTILSAMVVLFTLVSAPQCVAFGPHGGGGGGGFHGGGGGFHGGGGGFHGGGAWTGSPHGSGWGGVSHGASWGGAYHGAGWHGGYYPWHGGYGWHGGSWGYPGYGWGGWGFGIGISFGWGGYWPAAPYYVYGYPAVPACSPYYPCYPYYPYGVPVSYPAQAPVQAPASYAQQSEDLQAVPAQPAVSVPRTVTSPSVTVMNASYRSTVSNHSAPTTYTSATRMPGQFSQLRPEVQNVIRALRAMPPAARQRQLDSGRYGNLSPQEVSIVRYAADMAGN